MRFGNRHLTNTIMHKLTELKTKGSCKRGFYRYSKSPALDDSWTLSQSAKKISNNSKSKK